MPDVPEPPTSATHVNYGRLVKLAQTDPIIAVAVAHPCDEVSLQSAVEAARLQLIEPILVGPTDRIRRVASNHGFDIDGMEIVNARHSHEFSGKRGRTRDSRPGRGSDEG